MQKCFTGLDFWRVDWHINCNQSLLCYECMVINGFASLKQSNNVQLMTSEANLPLLLNQTALQVLTTIKEWCYRGFMSSHLPNKLPVGKQHPAYNLKCVKLLLYLMAWWVGVCWVGCSSKTTGLNKHTAAAAAAHKDEMGAWTASKTQRKRKRQNSDGDPKRKLLSLCPHSLALSPVVRVSHSVPLLDSHTHTCMHTPSLAVITHTLC